MPIDRRVWARLSFVALHTAFHAQTCERSWDRGSSVLSTLCSFCSLPVALRFTHTVTGWEVRIVNITFCHHHTFRNPV